MNNTEKLIAKYELTPHPEGGYFKELYRSKQTLLSPVHSKERNSVTHIYFLLSSGQISRFHRVEHDEIWNFYEGDPLRLIMFNGEEVSETVIGSGCDHYTAVVPAGVWQAAEPTGEYSLVGCSVAPGFDFEDFRFMSEDEIENISADFAKYEKFC